MWQWNFMEGSKSRVCLAYPTSHVGVGMLHGGAACDYNTFRKTNNRLSPNSESSALAMFSIDRASCTAYVRYITAVKAAR